MTVFRQPKVMSVTSRVLGLDYIHCCILLIIATHQGARLVAISPGREPLDAWC